MKKEAFHELLESVKQGGAILKGKIKAGRIFNFDHSNVKKKRSEKNLLGVTAAHPDALADVAKFYK